MSTVDSFVTFLLGAVIALLPFFLTRHFQSKSLKKAIKTEMSHIYQQTASTLKQLTDMQTTIPNYNILEESLQIASSPFRTPVIDTCYDKIDLLDEKTVSRIVKVGIRVAS